MAIFFSISAWYFINSEQSIRRNFKRVWILERELLFWSLTLLVIFLAANRRLVSLPTIVYSILPLTTNLWWYATAYAMFLIILPFLQYALLAIGKTRHCQLAAALLFTLGPLSLLPISVFRIFDNTVFGFIYMFILLSCYKLYCKDLSNKILVTIIAIGIIISIPYYIADYFANLKGTNLVYNPFGNFALPTLMVACPVFLIFERKTIHVPFINFIAKSAFSVYLITEYPPMRTLLWSKFFNLSHIYGQTAAPLRILGILLVVYAACTLCDFIRRGLFALTVDRRPGQWFDALWRTVAHWKWVQSLPHLLRSSPSVQ